MTVVKCPLLIVLRSITSIPMTLWVIWTSKKTSAMMPIPRTRASLAARVRVERTTEVLLLVHLDPSSLTYSRLTKASLLIKRVNALTSTAG